MAAPDANMFRLRVQDGDTQHVYRGVSANTWLTPIGLEVYRPGNLAPKGTQLSVPCAQSVQQRAKSANAILGRRHYETDQQGLGANEAVTGRSISSLSQDGEEQDEHEDESIGVKFQIPPPSIVTREMSRPRTVSDERTRGYIPRPYTSVGEHRTGYKRADLMECSAFMVQPLQTAENKKNTSRCRSALVPQDTLSFRSMKYSLDRKLVNADDKKPGSRSSDSSRPELGETRRRLRHAWVAPSLRPLMYDEELAATACTSSCQGCFKACLASDDYFTKHEQHGHAHRRPAPPKPQLQKRPIRQIKREFPNLQYLMLAKKTQEAALQSTR